MTESDPERLQATKEQLTAALERRIGELLGDVRAAQEVSRQLLRAQRGLQAGGGGDASLHDEVDRLESLKSELLGNLDRMGVDLDA